MNLQRAKGRAALPVFAAIICGLFLSGCGGGNSTGPAAAFTLDVTPTATTMFVGDTANYTVTITPTNGFNSDITLSVVGLPDGATGSFTPQILTSAAFKAGGSSSLQISTTAVGSVVTPSGASTVTVTGTGGGVTMHKTLRLVVQAPGGLAGTIK